MRMRFPFFLGVPRHPTTFSGVRALILKNKKKFLGPSGYLPICVLRKNLVTLSL